MSILHNSARREWYLPSYRMSKQANQTRHVAEKREQDQHRSQDTKHGESSIIPLIPSRDRQGPPQSPVLPPKRQAPRFLGDPPPDFFQMVFCMLAHTRQIAQIDPTRLIIHQLPRQKILVRLQIQQSLATIAEH